MNTNHWFLWGESDLRAAIMLRNGGEYHLSAYHASQAGEKYLKGVLFFLGISPKHTRSLHAINDSLKSAGIDFELSKNALATLTRLAIDTRYPRTQGDSPYDLYTETDAEEAILLAEHISRICQQAVFCNSGDCDDKPEGHDPSPTLKP